MLNKHKRECIAIEGYLTQAKLETALKSIVGAENWKGRELNVPRSRRRWDMAYSINGVTTVVEFDGDAHYRDSLKIKVDREKDVAAQEIGYLVVRFPYWLQLTDETIDLYFRLSANILQDFPHGFITTKIFPASFCELGIERFQREMAALPETVKKGVVQSLKDRSKEHGDEYVLPKNLRNVL